MIMRKALTIAALGSLVLTGAVLASQKPAAATVSQAAGAGVQSGFFSLTNMSFLTLQFTPQAQDPKYSVIPEDVPAEHTPGVGPNRTYGVDASPDGAAIRGTTIYNALTPDGSIAGTVRITEKVSGNPTFATAACQWIPVAGTAGNCAVAAGPYAFAQIITVSIPGV